MRPSIRLAAGTLGVAVILAGGLRADLVRFRAGGEVDLPTRAEGPEVVVEAPGGPVRFARKELLAIVPHPSPADLWPSKREAALRGGTAQCVEAAAWAVEHGLIDEAEAMYREARRVDPACEPAARVVAILDALEAPCPDPAPDALGFEVGDQFRVSSGPHIILIHQHFMADADQRLAFLEQVLTGYYVAFASRGMPLRVPAQKLVTVWFARKSDYRAFLRAEGASAFLNTEGYYHPVRRVVFAYDERSDEPYSRAPSRPAAAEDARIRLLLDLRLRTRDIATAAHELVHLLAAESGLAPRHDDLPIWLHEGLAMQFEPARGGRWAGVGPVNPLRLGHWRGLPEAPSLIPLLRDSGFGRGYRSDRYAAAWGLVAFLWHERPEEFLAFLDLLRTPNGAPEHAPSRVEDAFRRAFGPDLLAIQRDWHRWMRSLSAG